MITARTLSVLPAIVEAERGRKRLGHVCEQAGMPSSLPDHLGKEFFIPQMSLLRFVDAAGRELGIPSLGLFATHMVSVRDYGLWGDYLLTASTLRNSFRRARSAMSLHSSGDLLVFTQVQGGTRITYRTAVAGVRSFENISFIGLGVIESVIKHFAGPSWRPSEVTLDFDVGRRRDEVEEILGSRVRFGEQYVSFLVPDHMLDLPNPQPIRHPAVTLADVTRARRGQTPASFAERTRAIVRAQLLQGQPDLEDCAAALMIGLRTLQRTLTVEGTSFREIAQETLFERAAELLAEPDYSVTRISAEMGYYSSSHFSRAFRKRTGMSPTQFREIRLR